MIIPSFRMIKARGCKQRFKSDHSEMWNLYARLYKQLLVSHSYYTGEPQLVYGTPVQLLDAQTEAVAYKPTLAQPSARNSLHGIGGG